MRNGIRKSWPALLDRRGFVFVLIAIWALAYLPNLGTRSLRLEEGRRATPAREMLASGDFAVPTLYGDTYLNKPPLFFWLVAAAGVPLGEVSPLAVRLPSVLAALGCALVALRFAPDVLDRRTRSLAALFVLTSATLLDKGTLGEIDATLCFVVAAALKVWWNGNRAERQSLASWVAVGLLLGLAVLLKGPAGPAIFYWTVGPFLVWQGQSRRLLTWGHLVCLMLIVLPSAAWVMALLDRGVVSIPELVSVWGHQLGTTHATGAVDEPAVRRAQLFSHYAGFPLQLLGMLFPAILWLPFAFTRRAVHRSTSEGVRRFLICAVVAPSLVFYLYPESRPRHLMPICFAAAMLAAVVVSGLAHPTERASRMSRRVSLLLSLVPAAVGTMALALAVWAYPDGLPVAVAVFASTVLWSCVAVQLTLRTSASEGHWTLAASLCGAVLAVWFCVNAVIVPWRAPQSPTRVALRPIGGRIAADEIVYTTRTFPNTGEGYYNLQFHLARDVRSADVELLKRVAPCVAVVTPSERTELEAGGWHVEEVSKLIAKGGPPEVHLIRLRPASGAASAAR